MECGPSKALKRVVASLLPGLGLTGAMAPQGRLGKEPALEQPAGTEDRSL